MDGIPTTVRRSNDETEALIWRGHITLAQAESHQYDHMHLWGLGSDFRLHDFRTDPRLAPLVRDDEAVRNSVGKPALEARDSQHAALIAEARSALDTWNRREAVAIAKRLNSQFRDAGKASAENDHAFRTTIDAIFKRSQQEHADREAEWARNKATKERIVSQAESAANSSDLRAAGDTIRKLGDEWKAAGPCAKPDNDALWDRFNRARSKLNDRRTQEKTRREAEWARNKATKERIVSQMSALASSGDARTAKDQARALGDQWRAVGPCAREDNERLRAAFNAARERLFDRAKQEGEQRKREARQRAQDRVNQLREQLYRTEDALRRAEESYSRALSARPVSMKNPNWYSISQSQLSRQSSARDKVSSIQTRRSEVLRKLMDAEGRLSGF
jgi:hypothetical protein